MLSNTEAKRALLKAMPGSEVKDYIQYRDVYLFRISFGAEDERDYDPFFSVDVNTGEVKDFSVLTDGDVNEISELFLSNSVNRAKT